MVVSNARYGLFGTAGELTDAQVDHIIATNLTGSIILICAALPHLRAQGGGRIFRLSSYGGQAVPRQLPPSCRQVGHQGLRRGGRPGGRRLRDQPDDRRTQRRPHPVPLRQRPRRRPSRTPTTAHPRTPPRAMLDPANGLASRRPPAHNRPHHRVRRHRTRPATPGPRLTVPGLHDRRPAQSDRRLREPARTRRVHGLPARGVTVAAASRWSGRRIVPSRPGRRGRHGRPAGELDGGGPAAATAGPGDHDGAACPLLGRADRASLRSVT
ncbi:SDR family NAD(P)-dependent oxidoreductase [Streptomyces massasporeus]